ncbi:MAG: ParB N-terminal domain-containing protein [Candidatus Krumholzibacteria bacterium]|nr:ParB N-terminal domain-containing protein [Candidatus Krumholzibacteria bacterium]MDH4336265.1 ParB N-terminal domain-containing protein [Candidatus Krumholzibacteria bacterium]MDH5269696.1 ParB N-terminal domain-containing protein [Candidatus Krumholzibacteria bacterium]
MGTAGVEKLTVVEIGVEKLTPNPWNPNRMSESMRGKLKAYLKREGFVEPLVVRPLGEGYQILGGFHRWEIAKELGYATVPCVVVEVDDKRAKILTINLNEMKGQSLPTLLANLVHDLSKELVLEDLEKQLPYSLDELKDSLDLLKIPDGLEDFLKGEAERQARERPQILTFVVEDAETVERAIEAAKRGQGLGTRGAALVAIARAYLAAEEHER